MHSILGALFSIPGELAFHASDPWAWRFHPDIWLLLVLVQGGYLLAITKLGPRLAPAGQPPLTPRQFIVFELGVLFLWAVIDGPVHTLAEGYLYSVHMVQHLVLTLVAPPLLLMGMPPWLLRWLLSPRPVMAVARVITRPIPALLFFNGVVVLTHMPAIVDLTLRVHVAHFAAHALIVAAAFAMWWPVVSPLKELPRISYPAQMVYLFAQSILPTVPASFLTFASEPLYPFYAAAPRLADISVVGDQRTAGLVMKLAGGFLIWAVIAVVFFRWYAEEEAETDKRPRWIEIERELEEMGLTKR